MDCPLVSVGIPTYNRPEGLRRTLEAITSQSYKNLEIIISDNCTPGENGEKVQAILRDFAAIDSRIRYTIQEKDMGPGYNFQFVLYEAKGEYFMWASDDDYWEAEFIATCMSELLSETDIAGVFCNFVNINHFGHEVRFFTLPSFGVRNFKNIFNVVKEHEIFGKANPIYSLFRKKMLLAALQISPFDEMSFSDANIVVTLQCIGGIKIIPKYMFRKTLQGIVSLKNESDIKNYILRTPIITNLTLRHYVFKLIKTGIKCNTMLPIFTALFARCCIEVLNKFKRVFKV